MRYGTYGVTFSPEHTVRCAFSKVREGSSINAWGMAREAGVEPITAENTLNTLVDEGAATKEGSWYAPTNPALPALVEGG